MGLKDGKRVLFLDSGDLARARAAEASFLAMAKRMGFPWSAIAMDTSAVSLDEVTSASIVVLINRIELEAFAKSRFPEMAERLVLWELPLKPEPRLVESAISDLIARLLGGRPAAEVPDLPLPRPVAPKKLGTVKLSKETAGRRGKGVTVISELNLDEAKLTELATLLKNKCGTGGTAKDGRIEIQGDQRDRLQVELEKLGYKVKRSGG